MRTGWARPNVLIGRAEEKKRLEALVSGARLGHGGAIVLHGEAGVGKSALLHHVRVTADLRVLRASGTEYESEVPFAALHQLCLPVLEYAAELPAAHREALHTAFGLSEGRTGPSRVGFAVLNLLSAAAADRPMICLTDDAQWVDSASARALIFAARRIETEPIAMIFAMRSLAERDEFRALPEQAVHGLSEAEAQFFLDGADPALDPEVRERLIAESRGNPLALLELPRAGGFTIPKATSVTSQIEKSYRSRLRDLPAEARRLLILASADPTGDPGLLWPAARLLEIDIPTGSALAGMSGLIEFGTRIRFCHPLARSVTYRTADVQTRRAAHLALAEVTDASTAPDRRAWHFAQACAGPDEDVAKELDRSAARARSRGGINAAAVFLERAAELSFDPGTRIERGLSAVSLFLESGALDAAASLLRSIVTPGMDATVRGRYELLRGRLAFARRGDADGPRFMLDAARSLERVDPVGSREAMVDALEMSLVVGRATNMMDEVLSLARSDTSGRHPLDVLDALALLADKGHRIGVPALRAVLHGDEGREPLWVRRPALAAMIASELWEPDTHAQIAHRLVRESRRSGSSLRLKLGLGQLASSAAFAGDLPRAAVAVAEEEAIADATGTPSVWYHRLHLAAMRGHRTEGLRLFATAAGEGHSGQLLANLHWATAVLHNSLRDHPAALTAARRAVAHDDLFLAGMSLPELVEAAVRCGAREEAVAALSALTERTTAGGTPTGLGIAAYARGLVTGREDDYQEAVEHLSRVDLVPYRARAHLLYGEWLRRAGRRKDCRTQLRTALDLSRSSGLDALARRAAAELRATGEHVRRSRPYGDQLTPQEANIARLAATGATSNEIATRLFLSPRTVDTHLQRVFRKLGIHSRRHLRDHPALRLPPANP
ncbi:LuxR family transcriptional regulator [Sphaerisporangium melleum]|uniref:LuxR family transcriptional regulator n=1 Tax=Sphaerisporangium melleum TaxID=321316 RepID=A0A917QUT2_9ACTN|nr:LuxR family transcriptional regulator [Sphaerisporangium melleum]GGK69079.1 LuxR family transcriptional regulator [Sphaerisporangium melleum]GII68968.1 LuxR family transcriptional regulator [Sphaerisporangium melleum]